MTQKYHWLVCTLCPILLHAQNSPEEEDLATITVTGQKIERSLQDTTASVSVISADLADRPSSTDITQLLSQLPNVVFGGRNALPTIRGLDSNGVAQGGNGVVSGGRPRATSYVDGVPRSYSFALSGTPLTWDIDQLEVYRGSQSTVLGRNSIAGAFVVTTRDPSNEFETAARLGYSDDDNSSWSGAALLNLPLLSDRLAARFIVDGSDGRSWVRFAGPLETVDDRVAKTAAFRGRLKLLWQPFGTDITQVKFTHESLRQNNPSQVDAVDPDDLEARRFSDPFAISIYSLASRISSLQASHDMTENWNLTFVASQQRSYDDVDPVIANDPSYLNVKIDAKEYTQELRTTYQDSNSRRQAVFGVFHYDRKRDELGTPDSAFPFTADDEVKTWAAFADATVPVGASFDVLLGARWESETQRRNFTTPFGFALNFDEGDPVFLPKAGLRWHLNLEQSIAAVYSRGYTAGGAGTSFLTFTPYLFKKETADTLELAWRSTWPAARTSANVNVFYSKYSDFQANGAGPGGFDDAILLNAARVRSYGLEADVRVRTAPQVDIFATLGVLRSTVQRFGDVLNDLNNGNDLGNAPELSTRLGADWHLTENISLSIDAQHVSDYFSFYTNFAAERVSSYTIANLNTEFKFGTFTLFAYANNLFDKTYATSRVPFSTINLGPPRTIGIALRAQFQ
jgi:iron complex outermembrane recepter protein